jgi:hypothetical protein
LSDHISQLAARADGLFIWASTAASFIIKARNPFKLFADLIESALPEQPLDFLYTKILEEASGRIGRNELPQFIKVLQLICVAREPLSIRTMAELLDLSGESEESVSGNFVASLGSVLSDGRDGKTVQELHPTFIEFVPRWRWQDRRVISVDDEEALHIQNRDAEVLLGGDS